MSLASLAMFAACGGGGGTTGGLKTGGDFIVLSTEPSENGQLFLNDAIRIDFSRDVDLASVDRNTFSFQVRDQLGNIVAEPVAGSFRIGTSPGDSKPGRRLLFVPRLPTNDLYTNGGFRPGRTYEVQLVGGNKVNDTTIRDTSGKKLALPRTFRFSTADGTTPGDLFRNTVSGGPRRAGFEITPTPDAATNRVVLNKLGAPSVEVRLRFDQALNPNSVNVPVTIDTNPETRNSNNRGRIYMQYDDVDGTDRWIPADVELESNADSASGGAVVVLRPLGVLPNNAEVEVIVANSLEDISGESNAASVAYEERFGVFRTRRAYEQQFDGVVEGFLSTDSIDFLAPFSEPMAEVGDGYIKAGFDFEGTVTGADFAPSAPVTVLNTDFTQVQPANGSAFNVSGGVFNFRNVTIPAGREVYGQGSNPMVWLCSGTFTVAGLLSVQGGDGQAVSSTDDANIPKAGGAGVCGGGDGGDGSPSETERDAAGGNGRGPLQLADGGGRGGQYSCFAGCSRGAGGGGGSLATQGDPNYKLKVTPAGTVLLPPPNPDGIFNLFPIFQQQTGQGGNGCSGVAGAVTRSLEGSAPGPTIFTDPRNDNNFWGTGVRYDTDLRITGELAVPVGGGGGGGGGDLSYNATCDIDDPNFQSDSSGGGGGGGGGVLIVKSLGPIIIANGGRISADGGMGGGGEPLEASLEGGGGGGGAGGMVILMSAERIVINARGTSVGSGASATTIYRYEDQNDYAFSISADGGVTKTGSTPPVINGKYPVSGQAILANRGTTYDSVPLGGFGGMGIVQLMAPPGTTNSDNTNTVLDDNIEVRLAGGSPLNGPEKQAMLAWRGFPNAFGQGVDDDGNVINPTNADNEGDIRPAPVLLPTPFAKKSRMRSIWIDTGATNRRGLTVDDDQPRGIVEQSGAQAGPLYEWMGTLASGYFDYGFADGRAVLDQPIVVSATSVLSTDANATYLGRPAYRVRLTQPALGTTDDRYVQYQAELLDINGDPLSSYRILTHGASDLLLSPENGALDEGVAFLQVRAKFFEVVTNGATGLGATYSGTGGQRPVANVRVGWAFHTDPSDENAPRYPAQDGTFAYQLDATALETIRSEQMSFVQWDILFDMSYVEVGGDTPPALNPETNRPELHFLRLPFRF